MNLAELIESRKRAGAGSLRDMEKRAADHGTPISRTALGDYANGKQAALPTEDVRRAIAAALDVSVDMVNAAAFESVAPAANPFPKAVGHWAAFMRLTEGRSDDEVAHLLGVVEAALRAMDAVLAAEYGRLVAEYQARAVALAGGR